ncbi:MAG TPA: enoyl-CoA hydratase-related protein, partial [Pyrinomonadaceae bacterium]|nr:enoyl-CoA hydratase-related protein [Pyrinomonadaceae bacterium]
LAVSRRHASDKLIKYVGQSEPVDSTLVIFERSDSFATIRINPPEPYDLLSRDMTLALTQRFKNLNSQPDLRTVILVGVADNSFCDETDGAEIPKLADAEVSEAARARQGLYDEIENCPIPVIAAIRGSAAGAGIELALACHLRIASPDTTFSFGQIGSDGIETSGRLARLKRQIRSDYATEIIRTRRTVPAAEALRIGLINRIAPEDQLLLEAESLARLISTMAPLAIRAGLEAVTRGTELPLAEGLALESNLFANLFATSDVREGTSAFLEKRKPVFKGR